MKEEWIKVEDVKKMIRDYINEAREQGEPDARGIRDGLCFLLDDWVAGEKKKRGE